MRTDPFDGLDDARMQTVRRMTRDEHDPGAANDSPDPDLDACDTLEEVLGWLLNNAPADERLEVNEVVELALRRIEQIMEVVPGPVAR